MMQAISYLGRLGVHRLVSRSRTWFVEVRRWTNGWTSVWKLWSKGLETELETMEVLPAQEDNRTFIDAESTCRAVYAAVNPGELSIRINRVIKGRNKAVRIVAEKGELDKIKPILDEAGLTTKQFDKLLPRLVIKDIPTDMDRERLVAAVAQQNLKSKSAEDIKLIYWYPKQDRRTTSAVIETSPAVRTELLHQGRIYIGWSACRITDHLRITQCFRCLGFGHIAKDCKAKTDTCGHCAGRHETRLCSNKAVRKCFNCLSAGLQRMDHSAVDPNNCPILRKKVDDKAKRIKY